MSPPISSFLDRTTEQPEGTVERVGIVAVSLDTALDFLTRTFGTSREDWVVTRDFPQTSDFDPGFLRSLKVDPEQFARDGAAIVFQTLAPDRGPMRTPAWVYQQPVTCTSSESWALPDDVIPEIEGGRYSLPSELPRMQVREHASVYHDHKHSDTLASVWFDGEPVMLFTTGYEGKVVGRFITDVQRYAHLISYLHSFTLATGDVVDVNTPIRGLTEFGRTPNIFAERS